MKISVIHRKEINMGDHAERVAIAIDVYGYESIESLVQKILTYNNDVTNLKYTDWLEIRVVKEDEPVKTPTPEPNPTLDDLPF
jgi:acyl-ACP thioesterase